MISATLQDIKTVSLSGVKSKWKIVKDQDVVRCDDQEFVRMAASNFTLTSLITEGNKEATAGVSLARSRGLALMIQKRNEQQAASFFASVDSKQCSLFSPSAPKKKPRVVTPRSQLEELRKHPEHLTLMPEVDGVSLGVDVLRAVHPKDNIFVVYEKKMLAHALCFIRSQGFEPDTAEVRRGDLPRGIHRRGSQYCVRYLKGCTSENITEYGYKRCADLEDAIRFQSTLNQCGSVIDADMNAVDDEEHQAACPAHEESDEPEPGGDTDVHSPSEMSTRCMDNADS